MKIVLKENQWSDKRACDFCAGTFWPGPMTAVAYPDSVRMHLVLCPSCVKDGDARLRECIKLTIKHHRKMIIRWEAMLNESIEWPSLEEIAALEAEALHPLEYLHPASKKLQ